MIHLSPPWDSLGEIGRNQEQGYTTPYFQQGYDPLDRACARQSIPVNRDRWMRMGAGPEASYANGTTDVLSVFTSFDHDAENPQKISLATSEDGYHYTKRPDFPTLRPDPYLEQIDYRDSYVFWNEDEQVYWMVLAARYKDGGPFHRKGVITYRTSSDLWNWSEDHALYRPGIWFARNAGDV